MQKFLTFLLLATSLPLAASELPAHPFVLSPESEREFSLPFEWGPTTLGYSQSWGGGESWSRGMMMKSLKAELMPGLHFQARMGLSYRAGAFNAAENARFELPEASLVWRPREDFVLRLQFSHGSRMLYPTHREERFPWAGDFAR